MDKEQLQEVEARANAATPPPWKVERLGSYADHDEARISLADDTIESCKYENATFIAHARSDVPALCAEVERLDKVVDTLAKTCERLSSRDLDYTGWCEVFGYTADQWREAVEKVVADELKS